MAPSFSGDGTRIAFTAWAWPGGTSRWSVLLYDNVTKKLIDLPKLNGESSDQRMPALSGDGRRLAYASNIKGGVGLTDIYLYDMNAKKVVAVPGLNSKNADYQPALSGDGRLVAFSSDRGGGAGGDIYLYDRVDRVFLPLPGLNSDAHEQSPSAFPRRAFFDVRFRTARRLGRSRQLSLRSANAKTLANAGV